MDGPRSHASKSLLMMSATSRTRCWSGVVGRRTLVRRAMRGKSERQLFPATPAIKTSWNNFAARRWETACTPEGFLVGHLRWQIGDSWSGPAAARPPALVTASPTGSMRGEARTSTAKPQRADVGGLYRQELAPSRLAIRDRPAACLPQRPSLLNAISTASTLPCDSTLRQSCKSRASDGNGPASRRDAGVR